MSSKSIQYLLASVFLILGGWCLASPSYFGWRSVRPKAGGSRTPSTALKRFSTAGVIGLALLAADLTDIVPVPAFVGKAEARIGQPWTPASGAGVARRTTRRIIRRSTVFIDTLPPACVRTSIDGITVWRCNGVYYQPYRGRYVVVTVK